MSIMYYLHTMGDIALGQNDQERSQPRALQMCFGLLPIMMMYSVANLGKDYFCTEMASRTKARLAAIIAEHFLLRASADASERTIALSLASSETNQVPPPRFPPFSSETTSSFSGLRRRVVLPPHVGLCSRNDRHQRLVFGSWRWSRIVGCCWLLPLRDSPGVGGIYISSYETRALCRREHGG